MPPVSAPTAWNAVMTHDSRFDGTFVYAVSSTKIYCRPSCPSRRPARHRVLFFRSPHLAEQSGFRPCLRCRPDSDAGSSMEQLVGRIRRYLDDHTDDPVSLRQLGALAGVSPFHLQRTFTRIVGLSPKAYHTARRMERFTTSLMRGETVTDATYTAGFGSSSRLYERASRDLGMTPAIFRAGGAGVTLRYTTVRTAVGLMLMAVTDRGLASVSLGDKATSLVARLQQSYPNASLHRDRQGLAPLVQRLLHSLTGQARPGPLPLDIRATDFQRKVWMALQEIPRGSTRTYREIAEVLGRPTAVRAVAQACARNPLAVAIPCHRVVRGDGSLAGYRWGVARKKRLLELERGTVLRRSDQAETHTGPQRL